MTENQKDIVRSIIEEFNRINETSKEKRSFNLINLDELDEKTRIINQYKLEESKDVEIWKRIREDRRNEVVELLKEDLPSVEILMYSTDRITLSQAEKFDKQVSFYVHINRQNTVKDPYGNFYSKGKGLYYLFYLGSNSQSFDKIEDLMNFEPFKEKIRLLLA